MKIHKFKCNICGLVFGLDNTGYGLIPTADKFELVNPCKAEIHICEECLTKLTRTGVELNLLSIYQENLKESEQ